MKTKTVDIEQMTEDETRNSMIYATSEELINQKFLTEYVACMAGVELPVEEEETDVQHFE